MSIQHWAANPREKAFDRLGLVRHDASQCAARHRLVNSGPPAQKFFRDDNDVASTNSESLAFIRKGRSNSWSQHAPAGRGAMKAMLRNSLRACGRLLRLTGEVLLALLDFVINVIFRPKLSLTRARSLWLQQACRRALRILNVTVTTDGTIPLKGLLVCNQFSYLDIFVISAITPAVFISSSEVKRLPILGWFASLSGTLFVRRTHRSDVTRLNQEFSQILSNGGLVVLFPEPVDSNADAGSGPFRSSLLEPAARLKQRITAAAISYTITENSTDPETRHRVRTNFTPSLRSLLLTDHVSATVSFTRLEKSNGNRKELARRLRHYVEHSEEPPARLPVA